MLSNSEFIINKKGRIYHLDLAPEDMADTVITVGDPGRVKQVSQHFELMHLKRVHREFVTHIGELNGKRIMVISTGIGTDNIDIVLNELDALVNIDFETKSVKPLKKSLSIIRLGTSGSIQSSIPIDSILVNKFAIGIDSLMHFYTKNKFSVPAGLKIADFNTNQIIQNGYWGKADNLLFTTFCNEESYTGICLTCPGFYGPQSRSIRLKSQGINLFALQSIKYQGLLISNMEMETAGIYSLSNALGHKAVSVNALLANRITGAFSKNPQKTIDRMIEKCLEKIGFK